MAKATIALEHVKMKKTGRRNAHTVAEKFLENGTENVFNKQKLVGYRIQYAQNILCHSVQTNSERLANSC